MARINNGTQRDWMNGDIVTSNDYEQDREILTVAINGTDDELTAHKNKTVDSTDTDSVKDKHVSNKDLNDIWVSLNNKYDTTSVYSKSELEAETGASRVGVTPIALTAPNNVQDTLAWLKNQQDSMVLGQIPDGSITTQKLAFDPATQAELDAVKSSVSDGKILVKNAITGKGGTVLDADGDGVPTHQELADGVNSIETLVVINGTATDTDVLSGKTYYNTDAKVQHTGTMANRGAMTITPGTTNQTIPQGYHNGAGVVVGDADLVPSNILSTANIFGVVGSLPNKTGSATAITPSTADQAIPQGYYGGVVTDGKVAGDTNLVASNIVSGKSIFGVAGNVTARKIASGTVTSGASQVLFRTKTDVSINGFPITVSSLTFQPTIIFYYPTSNPANDCSTYYASLNNTVPEGDLVGKSYDVMKIGVGTAIDSGVVTSTGFTLPAVNQSTQYSWVAYL